MVNSSQRPQSKGERGGKSVESRVVRWSTRLRRSIRGRPARSAATGSGGTNPRRGMRERDAHGANRRHRRPCRRARPVAGDARLRALGVVVRRTLFLLSAPKGRLVAAAAARNCQLPATLEQYESSFPECVENRSPPGNRRDASHRRATDSHPANSSAREQSFPHGIRGAGLRLWVQCLY